MSTLTDQQVFDALPADGSPIPAVDLTARLRLAWPGGARDIRTCLMRLRDEKRADIAYGDGWYRTTDVVPRPVDDRQAHEYLLAHGVTARVVPQSVGPAHGEITHLGVTVVIDRQTLDAGEGNAMRPGTFVWVDVADPAAVPGGEIHVRVHDQPVSDGPIA